MKRTLKRLASRLPARWQMILRRLRYRALILAGKFDSDEPEFEHLPGWIEQGDWVLDIGANLGHYTLAMSGLVGRDGRVIALEPVPPTFELLVRHVGGLADMNVTLLNAAASDRCGLTTMRIPSLDSGLANLYQSRIDPEGGMSVLSVSIDALSIEHPIRLMKVDVEGHEMSVLHGARDLIERDRPILILEGNREEFLTFLAPLGYERLRYEGSPNTVFLHD